MFSSGQAKGIAYCLDILDFVLFFFSLRNLLPVKNEVNFILIIGLNKRLTMYLHEY